MTVFTRKIDEGIVLSYGGEEIVVTVVSIKGDKVRLGIEAPLEVPVHRGEIHKLLSQDWPSRDPALSGISCNVWVPKQQLHWLDEIATQLDLEDHSASRQLLIEAILDALASVDLDWRGIMSLADLKTRLRDALRTGNRL